MSGSGISWAVCKSAPCYRQITTPAPHHSVFYRPDALPAAQPTVSKHWRQVRYLDKSSLCPWAPDHATSQSECSRPNAAWVVTKIRRKVKVARLPSVWFRSWSRFLAVSLQVKWVINPAVGCHYFPPGLQLPPQPLRRLLPILLLGLPKTVSQQRGDCDLNPGPSAAESSTLTTRLPSHP